MEDPEKKITKHVISEHIDEKYIKEHINAAVVVADNSNKSVEITRQIRQNDRLIDIIFNIQPGVALDKVMEDYSKKLEKIKQLDGNGKDAGKISSPTNDINRQDI